MASGVLSDGTTSITFALSAGAGGGLLQSHGADFGELPLNGTPRQMRLPFFLKGSTKANLLTRLNDLRKLLRRARTARARDGRRLVTLTLTPTSGFATIWQVIAGEVTERADPFAYTLDQQNAYMPGQMLLQVEPYARGSATTLTTAGACANAQAITHQFTAWNSDANFSPNMVGLIEGSLWQVTKFSTSPTLRTPAVGDNIYIGGPAKFIRIDMGLRQAATGITFVVEFSTGAGWSTLTLAQDDFLSGGQRFGLALHLGRMAWTDPGTWATRAVNGVTQYWIRFRVTAVSSPVAPIRINGPIRSYDVTDLAITSSQVVGDAAAEALVHYTSTGNQSAAVYVSAPTGHFSDISPPAVAQIAAADINTGPSGDTTIAVETDTQCVYGERVKYQFWSALSDRAQTFFGTNNQYAYRAGDATSAEYLQVMQGKHRWGMWFKLRSLPTAPGVLLSQWGNTKPDQSFVLCVDPTDPDGNGAPQLRAFVRKASNQFRYIINGTTNLDIGVWYFASLEWDAPKLRANLYLGQYGGVLKEEGHVSLTSRMNLVATSTSNLMIGHSHFWDNNHSRDEDTARSWLDFVVGEVWLRTEAWREVGMKVPLTVQSDGATTALLLTMNDNNGTVTLADTATTRNAAVYNFTRATQNNNESGVSVAGPFATSMAYPTRLAGIRLAQTHGEEYAGRYRLLLMAKPAAALTYVKDFTFWGMIGYPDPNSLPFTGPPAQFPDTSVPTGYYPLDLGVVTLPVHRLYEGHASQALSSSRQHAEFSIYVQATGTSLVDLWLDNLYLLPLDDWHAHYRSFRDGDTWRWLFGVGEGLLIDGTSPRLVVAPTTTSGYTEQQHNPWGQYMGGPPTFTPAKPAWLRTLILRGVFHSGGDGKDYLERRIGDWGTLRLAVVPLWEEYAAA